MSQPNTGKYGMSPLKLALAARQLSDSISLMRAEPIAVIGMGCRFPGKSDSPEAYWQLLENGTDAVSEFPRGRFDMDRFFDPDPKAPGKMYCRYGSFIEDVDRFDARFFNISPREANAMDPQQRILLEVCWQAITRAGYAPENLFGTNTGVFIGISTCDYAALRSGTYHPELIDPYYVSGTVLSVAAGRLSYLLGVNGPSMAVDTACSSSLVSTHLACESLRRRECDMALTGGVGLILAPGPGISFCKAGMLSADGRCKTFDQSADGYGRGEGCGMLVLKRLSDALSDNDTILALIRGSSVNQDGASGGLTVPSGPSQEAVIASALANSGILPDQVGYIEAHGTGTSLGDPIEIQALGQVFCQDQRPQPLMVGSVKTNFGHLEAAAGVAGMIKVALMFEHGLIPEHLHFTQPNPNIDWHHLNIQIPKKSRPFVKQDNLMTAGISSFGFCGTNAHVVMQSFDHPSGARPSVNPMIDQMIDFNKNRYWIEPAIQATPLDPASGHLPGKRIDLPFSDEIRFECRMNEHSPAYIRDHKLFGTTVVAGASHISMVIEGVSDGLGQMAMEITDMNLIAPLVIDVSQTCQTQLILSPAGQDISGQDTYGFKIVSNCNDQNLSAKPDWSVHATGKVRTIHDFKSTAPHLQWSDRSELQHEMSGPDLYRTIAVRGHHLGPSFCRVQSIFWQDRYIRCRLSPAQGLLEPYRLAPGLIDSCFQFFCIHGPELLHGLDLLMDSESDAILVPFSIDRIQVASFEKITGPMDVHVMIRSNGSGNHNDNHLVADMVLCDSQKQVLAECQGFTVRKLDRKILQKQLGKDQQPSAYKVDWIKGEFKAKEADPILRWLILADQNGLGTKISKQLKTRNQQVTIVDSNAGLETILQMAGAPDNTFDRILYLRGLDIEELSGGIDPSYFENAYDRGCLDLMHLVQSLAKLPDDIKNPQLTVVTNVNWTGDSQEDNKKGHQSPLQAMLWGMGRVIAKELPQLKCTLIDWLDTDVPDAYPDVYIDRLIFDKGFEQFMFANGSCLSARLLPYEIANQTKWQVYPDKTYLITGGTGGLGQALAKRLIEKGAMNLVLTGRKPFSETIATHLAHLGSTPIRIEYMQADVSEIHDVRTVLDHIVSRMPSLGGVFHAAGVIDDGLLIRQTPERMRSVLKPKVQGAFNLHELTQHLNPDVVVFFSSMSALFGTMGQASYAAANAVLDGLSLYRRRHDLPSLSIDWAGWEETGMAAALSAPEKLRLQENGIGLIKTKTGLDWLETLISADIAQVALLNMDWNRYGRKNANVLIQELWHQNPARGVANKIEPILAHQLESMANDQRHTFLSQQIWQRVVRILGLSGNAPMEAEIGLFDLGMDSIMAVQLKDQLEQELAHPLQSTLVFNYPTVFQMASYLLDALFAKNSVPELKTVVTPNPDTGIPAGSSLPDNDLEQLSEDDMARLLDQKLASLNRWIQ